jgi:GH15 family glucan-1,4-alpha-glucosidase
VEVARVGKGGREVTPNSLELALIGNGTIGALVDPVGDIVWACFPRFDGDPAFCALLGGPGHFGIELVGAVRHEQEYVANTPILVTRAYDGAGGTIEITDFAPRFRQFGRMFCPMMLVRRVQRIAGHPRIRVRVHATWDYGRAPRSVTFGSNHVRYVSDDGGPALRLTTDVPVTAVLEQSTFLLEDAVTLLLGPDETAHEGAASIGARFLGETTAHWHDWVRSLAIPFEWQDAVIRAAISLQLNVYEDTGAIIAAMTTSVPEAAGSTRNWDYRYCWLRDASFVINALNRLGVTQTMERYLAYILNIVAEGDAASLQPLYGITGRRDIPERVVNSLPGYRGMGPVRAGNAAALQAQHDVYGAAILAGTHAFFDHRLVRRGDPQLFRRLEPLGEVAAARFDQPDAGLWELRGNARLHTFSAVMCWAGCDRLARIAGHMGLPDREAHWRAIADRMHGTISERSWNAKLRSFTATMDGDTLDASLLRLHEIGFLDADDPRFAGTVEAIGRDLKRGEFIFRYVEADDFGPPENAFLVCTFWYINALFSLGERDEARVLFEHVLTCRNRLGLLAEHIDPRTHEQWGNFVQTYSMVGLISAAIRLSIRWDQGF